MGMDESMGVAGMSPANGKPRDPTGNTANLCPVSDELLDLISNLSLVDRDAVSWSELCARAADCDRVVTQHEEKYLSNKDSQNSQYSSAFEGELKRFNTGIQKAVFNSARTRVHQSFGGVLELAVPLVVSSAGFRKVTRYFGAGELTASWRDKCTMKRPTLLTFRFMRTTDNLRNKYFVYEEKAGPAKQTGGKSVTFGAGAAGSSAASQPQLVAREVSSLGEVEDFVVLMNKKCGGRVEPKNPCRVEVYVDCGQDLQFEAPELHLLEMPLSDAAAGSAAADGDALMSEAADNQTNPAEDGAASVPELASSATEELEKMVKSWPAWVQQVCRDRPSVVTEATLGAGVPAIHANAGHNVYVLNTAVSGLGVGASSSSSSSSSASTRSAAAERSAMTKFAKSYHQKVFRTDVVPHWHRVIKTDLQKLQLMHQFLQCKEQERQKTLSAARSAGAGLAGCTTYILNGSIRQNYAGWEGQTQEHTTVDIQFFCKVSITILSHEKCCFRSCFNLI